MHHSQHCSLWSEFSNDWTPLLLKQKKKITLNMDQRQDFKYRNKKQHYVPSSLKLVIPSMLNSEELVSSSSIAFWHLKKNQQVSNCLVKDTTWQPVVFKFSVAKEKKVFLFFFIFWTKLTSALRCCSSLGKQR